MTDYDVIIVGAGIAGLTAARQLIKEDPGLRILILEAKDRIGGKTCSMTVKCHKGEEKFDFGGQWIGGNQRYIRSLVAELGLELHPQYIEGKSSFQFTDKDVVHFSDNVPFRYLPIMLDFGNFIKKIDAICTDKPEIMNLVEEYDSMTMEQFKNKHLWTKDAGMFIDGLINCLFGSDPSQISAAYFLHYCTCVGGLAVMMAPGETGGQAFSVKGGSSQICDKMGENLGEGRIKLNNPVQTVTQRDNAVTMTTKSGHSYTSGHVIMACPPNQLSRMNFQPLLPPDKRYLYEHLPAGTAIKTVITFKEAFWRRDGLNGTFLTYGGNKHATNSGDESRGPLSSVYDACTSNENPALVAFICASQAVTWSGMEESVRREAVLDSLAECFGPEIHDFIDYKEKDWSLEMYIGGSTYPASTGVMKYYNQGLRQPYGRLHFASSESGRNFGSMNGAVESGLRAAHEVFCLIRPGAVAEDDLDP